MNKKKISLLILLVLSIVGVFSFRNHLRLLILKKFPVQQSALMLYKSIDETYFKLDLYTCTRNFNNRWVRLYNSLYSDEIAVFQIPLDKYAFNNLVMEPIGKDEIASEASLYFNTMFFDPNFIATKGIIDDRHLVNQKNPIKKRIGIDKNGRLTSFSGNQNAGYNDVLQAPFTFSPKSKVNANFRTLNYRQFISIKGNQMIFITGFNNSLISWIDVKALMPQLGLTSIIALDGGASVEYSFVGKKNEYYFSSIPLRHLWFGKNSPYYLEGKQINN
jgi:hypothetical protein